MPALSPINEILTLYGALVYGLLLLAGLVLAVLHCGFRKDVRHAWSSLTGWLLMIPLATAAVLLGREAVVLFATAASVLGYWEYARATGLTEDRQLALSACLGVVAVGMVSLASGPVLRGAAYYEVFMTLPVALTAGILLVPVLRDRFHGQIRMLAVAVVGCLYFGWMAGHISLLANAEQPYAYLLFLVFAVEVNDVAAFAGGRLFGRTSLRKSISPNKTWEGALAGLAVSLTLPWLLWFTFPHFRWWDLVAIGVIVGAGGQMGDLVISVIKRDMGLRNMGTVIPGHGGILDRIDSLIYVAPLFTHYIRFRHGLNLGA
jgi:phosphatidate cytidylyltransferase